MATDGATGPPGTRWRQWRSAGALNVAAKLVGTGLAFALNVVLARHMTREAFGEFALILGWVALATAFVSLSAPLLLMRFVAEYTMLGRVDLLRGLLRFCSAAVGGCLLLLTVFALLAVTAASAGWLPGVAPSTRLVAALLLPQVLLVLLSGLLQACGRALQAELLSSLCRSVLTMAGVLALAHYWNSAALGVETVVALLTGVTMATTVACAVGAGRAWRLTLASAAATSPGPSMPPTYDTGTWTRTGLSLLVVLVAAATAERIDLLMLGARAPAEEVASYAVAQRIAQAVLFAVGAVGTVMAPRFVAALPELSAGRGAAAQAAVRAAGRMSAATSGLALAGLAALGPWITGLFGPGYASAYLPLLILVAAQFVAACLGPGILVASLSNNTRVACATLVMGIVLNMILNWLTVPAWGALGAAVSTAIAGVVAAAVAQAWLQRRLGIPIVPWGRMPRRAGESG